MLKRLTLAAALAAGLASPAAAQVAYTTARPVTPGTPVPAGSGYRVACSAAGFVRLILTDGSLYDIYGQVGTGGEDNIAVIGVAATGTPSPAGACVVTVLSGGARR